MTTLTLAVLLLPAALGILQGITGLAVVAGPVIGGAVAEGIAWEWIFWLNVPIGVGAIPLALARIEQSFGVGAALDLGGFAARPPQPVPALEAA